VEKNYIDSIFHLSEATASKTHSSPPKNKKSLDTNTVKISNFITQKINPRPHKTLKHSNNTEKNDEIIGSRSSFDDNPLSELKIYQENNKMIRNQTPNDSKETNTTLNSTQRPSSNAAADFIVKIHK